MNSEFEVIRLKRVSESGVLFSVLLPVFVHSGLGSLSKAKATVSSTSLGRQESPFRQFITPHFVFCQTVAMEMIILWLMLTVRETCICLMVQVLSTISSWILNHFYSTQLCVS